MKTRLSENLQTGKAGEHLACCDLITQGYNAFLSDQGLPFDIIVENEGELYRGQVKTVNRIYSYHPRSDQKKASDVYRFTTRRGNKKGNRVSELKEVDFYVFVVLSKKLIAYMWTKDLVSKNTGKVNQLIEFKDRDFSYPKDSLGRILQGKYIQDFEKFTVDEILKL